MGGSESDENFSFNFCVAKEEMCDRLWQKSDELVMGGI